MSGATGRSRKRTWITASAAVLVVGAAFLGLRAVVTPARPAAAAAPAVPAPAAPAPVPAATPPSPGAGPPAAPAAPALAMDALAGGRTVRWWQDRLELLRRGGDENSRELFAATVSRAEANGLTVTVSGDAVRVTVSEKRAREVGARP